MPGDETTPADETTTTTTTTTIETNVAPTVQAGPAPAPSAVEEKTVLHHDLAQWYGKRLIDRDGEKIGKLESVYVDVDSDEPQFGTLKEGHFGRHLTFVPLDGATIGPDDLRVVVSRQQVKDAPNIDLHGDELSEEGESALYHHYQLNYTPSDTQSPRRLVRR
jgi:hypothetical protein